MPDREAFLFRHCDFREAFSFFFIVMHDIGFTLMLISCIVDGIWSSDLFFESSWNFEKLV